MFTERVVCSHKILFSLLNKAEWSHLPSPKCSSGEREHLFSPGVRGDLPEQINRNGCFLIKSALSWGRLHSGHCYTRTLAALPEGWQVHPWRLRDSPRPHLEILTWWSEVGI